MKKFALLLIFAALIAFSGCSSEKNNNIKDDQRVEAPNDPDTEKRPTTTQKEEEDETTKSESFKPVESDKVTTSTKDTDKSTVTSSLTTKADTTAAKGTTANKEVTPAVPMSYRIELKDTDGSYLVDADYNMAYVKNGDDPTFHKTVVTKFDDKRISIYCSDLNKSLLVDKDGSTPIDAVSGRLEMPYDNFLIAYKDGTSAKFRICDTSTAATLISTYYDGFNEMDDGNVSLLLGNTQIDIFDGETVTESRKFEAVYYYVTTYALVREDGYLRFYNTNFELLADFGEMTKSNKMHFDETIFDGKDTFEFFFDSGNFKYEPAPEDETKDTENSDESTVVPDTSSSEVSTTETTLPETKVPDTTADTTSKETTPPDTTPIETSHTETSDSQTTKPETTAKIPETTTKIPETSYVTEKDSESTSQTENDRLILVAQANGIKLYEASGAYIVNINDRYIPVNGLTDVFYAEIISSNVNVISILNRDYSMSAYMINDDSVDEINVGLVEVNNVGDLTVINGAIRSYVLLDGEIVLGCSGGYTVSGNFLLCYDMVADESSAYTLDCELLVAPDEAVGLVLLDQNKLLVGLDNGFSIINGNYNVIYSSREYDELYMALGEQVLVNDGGFIRLIDLNEKVIAEFDDVSDWTAIYLSEDDSGYTDSGTFTYYFTFYGLKNGKYTTVKYTYVPKTGAISVKES